MTDLDRYISFVEFNNRRLTLGEIMDTHFGCEYRKFHSLMRRQGWRVEVALNRKEPGKNLYVFERVQRHEFKLDEKNQYYFA